MRVPRVRLSIGGVLCKKCGEQVNQGDKSYSYRSCWLCTYVCAVRYLQNEINEVGPHCLSYVLIPTGALVCSLVQRVTSGLEGLVLIYDSTIGTWYMNKS